MMHIFSQGDYDGACFLCEPGQLAPLVDHKGVVIFRYQGETAHVDAIDHWVCGVAATLKPFRLHLACSYRKTHEDWKPGGRYREQYREKVKRYFNNWLGLHHDCRIFAGSVFRIWRDEIGQDAVKTDRYANDRRI